MLCITVKKKTSMQHAIALLRMKHLWFTWDLWETGIQILQ